ncbi:hypothetical protein LTR10_009746 [Elasticomyces elasticus]|nr:hypothetical protein LTR10_009746 [Elasticomyces elasticus]KAK4970036.1 hypothetical protein LTR42_008203 [Elasticomyces elasticus]
MVAIGKNLTVAIASQNTTTLNADSTGTDLTVNGDGLNTTIYRGHHKHVIPNGFVSWPAVHYGSVPGSTTCFNQGPQQLHAWMGVLVKTFCDIVDGEEFDSISHNTLTGYWDIYPFAKDMQKLSKLGGWFSQYPLQARLQIGVTPHRSAGVVLEKEECMQSFSIIIDGCNTDGLDNKQGGQLMLGQDALWGNDQLYYTLDTNFAGHPENEYFVDFTDDYTFDFTKDGLKNAMKRCGSSCIDG